MIVLHVSSSCVHFSSVSFFAQMFGFQKGEEVEWKGIMQRWCSESWTIRQKGIFRKDVVPFAEIIRWVQAWREQLWDDDLRTTAKAPVPLYDMPYFKREEARWFFILIKTFKITGDKSSNCACENESNVTWMRNWNWLDQMTPAVTARATSCLRR